jgi:hypothetical protein
VSAISKDIISTADVDYFKSCSCNCITDRATLAEVRFHRFRKDKALFSEYAGSRPDEVNDFYQVT